MLIWWFCSWSNKAHVFLEDGDYLEGARQAQFLLEYDRLLNGRRASTCQLEHLAGLHLRSFTRDRDAFFPVVGECLGPGDGSETAHHGNLKNE